MLGICHHLHMSFFPMDARITCIRRKATGKFFFNFIIMLHTFRSGLLITSHDKTHTLVQLDTGITQKFHSVKCLDDRSLIVCRSAAIDVVAITRQGKRIVCPVTAGRDHIQMSCDTNDLIPLAHFCITTVIVEIDGAKAQSLCDLKSHTKRLCRSFAKWLAFLCLCQLRINGNQFAQIFYHFF